MSLDSDVIVDRRRIRRKLTFWRVAAVAVAIAAIVAVGLIATPGGRASFFRHARACRGHPRLAFRSQRRGWPGIGERKRRRPLDG